MTQVLKPTPALRDRILQQGCYGAEENQRIYDKWFAPGPRHQFQAVNAKYGLTDKVICDIGCSYGMNILHCQPASYGIEIDGYQVNFARSIGLTIYSLDFMHDNIDDLPKVDAVWCSALVEHVESIHTFLRKIAILLKPDGLVVIYVPTIPLIPALRHLPGLARYTTGHLYSDHINAFTPSTLSFFCERAGYETLDASPFLPGALAVFNHVPLLNRLVDGCTYVGRKIPGWEYPAGATRQATDSGKGYVYHDWFTDNTLRDAVAAEEE
jgi:SAM-dependent methyltransferase